MASLRDNGTRCDTVATERCTDRNSISVQTTMGRAGELPEGSLYEADRGSQKTDTTDKKLSVSGKVLKTMWLFSWVQIITIAGSVIRTKLVAIWIGSVGIGLFGLFNNAVDTICVLTQLGIRQSSVRNLAAASATDRIRVVTGAIRRWSWLLGIIGALLTLLFSPLLSELTFGNRHYTLGFIILSVAVFLSSITNGELAIMQGMDKLNRLAKSTVYGSIAGLIVSIPLFYWLGESSIVWSILAYFVCNGIAVWLVRIKFPKTQPPIQRPNYFAEGKEFILLGIFMTISVFIAIAVNYIFMIYLNFAAGIAEVGEYQAGYTIVTKYLGLIFTAIGLEFYPRLSKVQHSRSRMSTFVAHEIKIALLVILPGATIMMSLDDLIIRMLYSSEFLPAASYVNYALAGTALRAVSWCMAFTILARGDGKIYLVTESISGVCFLIFSYIGFNLGGLEGLGIASAVWYGAYTVNIGIVYLFRYKLKINRGILLLILTVVLLIILCSVARVNGMRWFTIAVAAVSSVIALRMIKPMLRKR